MFCSGIPTTFARHQPWKEVSVWQLQSGTSFPVVSTGEFDKPLVVMEADTSVAKTSPDILLDLIFHSISRTGNTVFD